MAPVEVAPVEVSEKVMAILNEVADEDEALCLDSALMDGIDSLGSTSLGGFCGPICCAWRLVINNIQASFGVHMTVTDWMDGRGTVKEIHDVRRRSLPPVYEDKWST